MRTRFPLYSCAAFVLPLAAVLYLTPMTAHAQATNPAIPPVGEPKPLALPKVVEETLPNGLKVVVLEDHKQPAVWIRLVVPGGGAVRDPKEKVGLATMTASLLDQGTKTRTESQIANTVDGLGASLGASADSDYAIVSASGLTPYTDTLLELVADIARNPTFPQVEADRYKARTMSAIQSALSNPGTLASAAFARAVYGAHPYGNFSLGTSKTLPTITVDDLKAFHAANYTPSGATLFLVGDITPAKAKAAAMKFLGDWKGSAAPAAPPAPTSAAGSDTPRILILDRPGAAQTEIRVGTLTTGYNDPKRVSAFVASAVLGNGSFSDRLMQEIRVKRGLTYGVASTVARQKEAGRFYVTTFTKNETTGETLKLILQTEKGLVATPPPAEELADRKTYLTGSYAISNATPDGVLGRLIPATLWGRGIEELNLFSSRVQATTAQEVSAILKDLTGKNTTIVLVGDAKAIESQVKDLGMVTVIPVDQLDLQSATLKADAASAATTTAAASPETAAKGKALMDMALKAHGGEKLLAIKNLTFKGKGTVTFQGNEIPVDSATLITAVPDKSRLEMKTGFGDVTTGTPGGGKPGWLNFGGQVQDQPNQGGDNSLDPATMLIRAVQKGYPVEAIADSATADGKKLTAFQVTTDKGRKMKIFIEADTGLVRRVDGETGQGSTTALLGAYKDVEGIKMPMTIELKVNGEPLISLKIDSVEMNKTVEDSLFEKPKG
jgi:zinc protease